MRSQSAIKAQVISDILAQLRCVVWGKESTIERLLRMFSVGICLGLRHCHHHHFSACMFQLPNSKERLAKCSFMSKTKEGAHSHGGHAGKRSRRESFDCHSSACIFTGGGTQCKRVQVVEKVFLVYPSSSPLQMFKCSPLLQ